MNIRFIAVDHCRVRWGHVRRQRKGKAVNLYPCIPELYGAGKGGGAEVWLHSSLTSALEAGGHFTPGNEPR